jgi:type VI secretion system protein ImpK
MFGSRDAKAHPSRAAARDEGADPGASEPAAPALPPRLVDLASDWLVLIPALRACADLPDAGRLRAHASELRTTFERNAKQAGFADADVQSAVFSLTAVFDETVKRARGKAREEWLARSLALDWFQTANAGVDFYTRLDELRKERSKRIDALEVAACCLALGFEGRLATAREARVDLINNLMLDVTAVRGQGEPPLAPHVIGKDRIASKAVAEVPRWIMAVAFVVALLLVWLGISQLSHLEAWRAVNDIKPLNP